jgi:hypothetical protein
MGTSTQGRALVQRRLSLDLSLPQTWSRPVVVREGAADLLAGVVERTFGVPPAPEGSGWGLGPLPSGDLPEGFSSAEMLGEQDGLPVRASMVSGLLPFFSQGDLDDEGLLQALGRSMAASGSSAAPAGMVDLPVGQAVRVGWSAPRAPGASAGPPVAGVSFVVLLRGWGRLLLLAFWTPERAKAEDFCAMFEVLASTARWSTISVGPD